MLGWLLLGGFVGGAATGLYWTYSTPTVREGTTEVYSPEVTILPEVVIEVAETAFVGPGAGVCGRAEVGGNAVVDGNAEVTGNALVYGDAYIGGNAKVWNKALVYGHAAVCDNAMLFGAAEVYGRATVYGEAHVCDKALIYGNAYVSENAEVGDYAQICGSARVSGNAHVFGAAKVFGDSECSRNPVNIVQSATCSITITDNFVHIGDQTFPLSSALPLEEPYLSFIRGIIDQRRPHVERASFWEKL
jgi:UDP-3-O-[3-hydroxymyristoyl] glucosamine N-acyltransferase